jgi:hypothetical protein
MNQLAIFDSSKNLTGQSKISQNTPKVSQNKIHNPEIP